MEMGHYLEMSRLNNFPPEANQILYFILSGPRNIFQFIADLEFSKILGNAMH